MKLNIDLKKLSSFKLSSLTANMGVVLWVFIGLMVLLVGWIVFGEISKITGLSTDTSAAQNQTIRVNIEMYKKLENRLDDNAHFSPQEIPKADVFSGVPLKALQ